MFSAIVVSQTCPCCRNRGYCLKEKELLFRRSVRWFATFMFLARPKPKSSTISNIACVTRLTDLGCIVTTTNLTAETSDKYSEHSSAVWNVYSSAWGWPALEREQILALSVRLLLCNQKMLSCNERKGSGTPSVSHFHTANASQHSCINSCTLLQHSSTTTPLYQSESFTSLSLTSAVCPPHLSLCTGSTLFHLSTVFSILHFPYVFFSCFVINSISSPCVPPYYFVAVSSLTLCYLTLPCFYLTLSLLYLAFVPSWLE